MWLDSLRTGDCHLLPPMLRAEILREPDRIELVRAQLKVVEQARDALLRTKTLGSGNPAALLIKLKGIGPEFASLLWLEALFRGFANRRQVAAYADWLQAPGRAVAPIGTSGSPRPAIGACAKTGENVQGMFDELARVAYERGL